MRCFYGACISARSLQSSSNRRRWAYALSRSGVYHDDGPGVTFVPVPAPRQAALLRLVHTIAERMGRSLERAGLITHDIENVYLAFDHPSEEAPIHALIGYSITSRIAVGRFQATYRAPPSAIGKDRRAAPPGDDMGTALRARLRNRDRALLALRRQASGDCKHRG
jgi:hypothetical protein